MTNREKVLAAILKAELSANGQFEMLLKQVSDSGLDTKPPFAEMYKTVNSIANRERLQAYDFIIRLLCKEE